MFKKFDKNISFYLVKSRAESQASLSKFKRVSRSFYYTVYYKIYEHKSEYCMYLKKI